MSKTLSPKPDPSPRCSIVPPEIAAGLLRLPTPNPLRWPGVRDRLEQFRGLDSRLLRLCHRRGLLYADSRRRAVFLCRDATGLITAAEVLATTPCAAPQTLPAGRGTALGSFWLATGPAPHEVTLLVENALEALAACQLLAACLPPGTRLVSTSGPTASLPRWLRLSPSPLLVCAYGTSARSERGAQTLRRRRPTLARLRPQGALDWNDLLRTVPPPPPTLFLPPVFADSAD